MSNNEILTVEIFNSLTDPVFVKDEQHRWVFLNDAFCQLIGQTRETLINQSDYDFFPKAQADIFWQKDNEVFQLGLPQENLEYFTDGKGKNRLICTTKSLLKASNGHRYIVGIIKDVTEKAEREEKLKKTVDRLQSLLTITKAGLWEWEIGTNQVSFSPEIDQMLGYQSGEIKWTLGKWIEIVHPDEIAQVWAATSNYLEGQTPQYETQYRMRTKSGEWRWFLDRAQGIQRNTKGEPLLMIGMLTDISDRKRAELALKESEIRWQFALESAGDGVWDWNLQTNEIFLSRQWKAMLGYSEDEIKPVVDEWDIRVHPDDKQKAYDDLHKHIRGESTFYENEHRLLCKDGSYKWILDRGKVIAWGADGQALRFIGTHTDITQRKQAETELQAKQQFIEKIATATPGILYVYNLIEHRNVYVNREIGEVLGYSPNEVQAMGSQMMQNLVHPDDFPKIIDGFTILSQAQDREVLEVEYRMKHKDGHWLWLYSRNLVFSRFPDGSVHETIGIATDITDKKLGEEELKEREKRFSAIFNSAFGFMGLFQPDGKVVEINQTALDFLGTSLDDIVGFNFWSEPFWRGTSAAHTRENRQKAKNAVSQVAKGNFVRYEVDCLSATGHLLTIDFSLKPIFNEQGEVVLLVGEARDITDRKQLERELAKNQAFLQSVLDNLPIGVMIKDAQDLSFVLWNQGCTNLFGFTAAEVIGKKETDFVPETQAELFNRKDREVLSHHRVDISEDVVRTKEGKNRIFYSRKTAIRDEHDQPLYVLVITEDVTEDKAMEQRLIKSEKRYQTLAEASPSGVYYTNYEGDCLYVNQKWLDLAGMTLEMAQGKGWVNAIYSGDRDLIFAEWYNTAAQGVPFRIECRFQKPDGSITWVISQAIPVIADSGEIEGYVGTITDISDQKFAEKQAQDLLSRSQMLNSISKQIRNSLNLETILQTAVTALGNQLDLDACVFAWYRPQTPEPLWESTHEYKKPDILSWLGIYECNLFPEIMQRLLAGQEYRLDNVSECRDLSLRDILASRGVFAYLALPVQNQQGELLGMLAMIRCQPNYYWTEGDVTLLQEIALQVTIAIKQAELFQAATAKTEELEASYRELQQAQTRLIQAEKMSSLGQLVAGVAHEINNPVSFIYGNIQPAYDYASDLLNLAKLYAKHYPEPHPEIAEELEVLELDYLAADFTRLLESMKNGATRIRDIVKSLRTFSRLDEADFKAVDLHENLDSTLVILQNRLNGRSGSPEITVIKEYGNIPLVGCYAGLLNQVFMNLLVNAIDAIEEKRSKLDTNQQKNYHGYITVTTANLVHDNRVLIKVKDNGCGIDETATEKIFNPFFTTKSIGKGTGLGLAMSYQIVTENHGGNLQFISTLGAGTEFIIELPVRVVS